MRVIGTAGHVDHGKSTLILALTGIDPDRLKEEKERGMTIDLGFAWLRLPSGQEVSIVDVPGHERFIKNMLAGVGGIDIALLVIAADEGVMPQTREHLAILDLLGIDTGVVALTKSDLVDGDWLDLVQADVEEVLAGTTLAAARVLPVSSTTGAGLDALRDELDRLLAAERRRRQTGWPRLPIDRIFTIAGFGTVVTGTLVDGELRVGQEVEIVPSGRRARIRGLESHRQRVEQSPAGNRLAINLSGLSTEDVQRGEVVTAPGWLRPTVAIDVRLRVVADAPKPLAHNARVTFHTGAIESHARVGLLDRQEVPPGESAWAQVRLDRPVAAVKGDLFVLRLPSPSVTVAGGTIVDDHPKRHRRFQEPVLQQLAILERGTPEEVLLQTLRGREPAELGALAKRAALTTPEAAALAQRLAANGSLLALDSGAGGVLTPQTHLVSAQGWERIVGAVRRELAAYHGEHRLRRGMPKEELRKRLAHDTRVFARIEHTLLQESVIAEDGPLVHLPEFAVRLTPKEEARAETFLGELRRLGIAAPGRGELQATYQLADELLQTLIDRGTVIEVGQDLVYDAATYGELVERTVGLIREHGQLTVGQMRDAFATSRKYALALLEHLDERRITRRVGDERVLI
ncbi:MAG: selenocysteine-specific elongation factor [Chloroflexota bacterium]|jgi:selenocysteine-specific elongation factor|nr:selenocysteine-specific elongation factor [Chloroflexota bacterium]